MSKRKGVSADEKRTKIQAIFYETRDFFQLKEVERLGSKAGVITQAVKDVLQSLVDDDLVHSDKIGTSRYYWAFPSEASSKRDNLNAQLGQLAAAREKLEQRRKALAASRSEGQDRTASIARLAQLEQLDRRQTEQLAELKESDPEAFKALQEGTKVALEAVNRWTDNVFLVQRWALDKFPGAEEALAAVNAEVGIPEDFDYVT
eukprot:jgi/Mesvir1/5361/Mv15444-RA.1